MNKLILRCCIGIDLIDDPLDTRPQRKIGKHLHNTALIGKYSLLQDRQVLHHSIVHDIFNNLVDKVDLTIIQIHLIQILCKSLLCYIHIHAHNLSHEFSERLFSELCFVVLATSNFAP